MLIGISVAGFFLFTNPYYKNISNLKAQVSAYNEALDNSKALENERDKLTKKYNSIDPVNLTKIQTLLPENVDNIRLILEIEKIALPYGMVLKDVKYDSLKKVEETSVEGSVQPDLALEQFSNKDYGTWSLSFSTEGTYNNFLNFIKDLEKNLRIVDISSIEFSSEVGNGLNPSFSEVYKYGFEIKTYWLKN